MSVVASTTGASRSLTQGRAASRYPTGSAATVPNRLPPGPLPVRCGVVRKTRAAKAVSPCTLRSPGLDSCGYT